jgi:hypothetical protein
MEVVTVLARILALCFIVLAQVACSSSGKPCIVELEQAPELRGFRLGMSLEDIRKRFPKFPGIGSSQIGLATVEISSAYTQDALDRPSGDGNNNFNLISAAPFPELNEVKHIELKLLDWRVIEITVYYDNDIKWKSADEFAQKTGEALKLDGTWHKVGSDDISQMRALQCGQSSEGFSVYAGFKRPPSSDSLSNPNLPYVTLKNVMSGEIEVYSRQSKIEEKKKREEEEQKKIFKP